MSLSHSYDLPTLDVSHCISLVYLDVRGSGVSHVDVSGCPALEIVHASAGQRVVGAAPGVPVIVV